MTLKPVRNILSFSEIESILLNQADEREREHRSPASDPEGGRDDHWHQVLLLFLPLLGFDLNLSAPLLGLLRGAEVAVGAGIPFEASGGANSKRHTGVASAREVLLQVRLHDLIATRAREGECGSIHPKQVILEHRLRHKSWGNFWVLKA